MKKAIICIIVLFQLSTFQLEAQSFVYKANTPFGIEIFNMVDSTRGAFKYIFKDLDGDKDLDLLLVGLDESDTTSYSIIANLRYFIEVQENIGTEYNPQFSSRQKTFESFKYPTGQSFMLPSAGDINGDKLIDFVINAEVEIDFIQFPLFYEQNFDHSYNISRCTEWELDPISPFSLFFPELIDLDVDGDLDLLLAGYYGPNYEDDENKNTFLYAKNTGTPTDPMYLGWFENPYGLIPDTFPQIFSGGDFDMDGDIDLLALGLNDNEIRIDYFENKPGQNGKPFFFGSVPSPFGLPSSQHENDQYLFPSLVDIDGDGDIDAFFYHQEVIDDSTGTVTLDYYENKLCDLEQEYLDIIICEGESYFAGEQEYNVSGSYFIETILSSGCKSITSLTLEVLPNITIYIDERLCYGESYMLGGNEITESGHYELSLMSTSGCDSTIIADLEFIELKTDIDVNGSILTAYYHEAYQYQWFDCDTNEDIDTATSAVFDAPYSGLFAVRITDEIGCEEESDCLNVVASSVWEEKMTQKIQIFPNPTNGILQIRNFSDEQILGIEIFDLSGKIILGTTQFINEKIDLSSFKQGLYYVKIKLDCGELIKKVILLK